MRDGQVGRAGDGEMTSIVGGWKAMAATYYLIRLGVLMIMSYGRTVGWLSPNVTISFK